MSSIVLPLLVIVRLTLLDALRRRILWVLFFLTVVVVGLSGLGFERLVSLARAHGSDELSIQLGVSLVDGPGRREAAFRHSDRGFPQPMHRERCSNAPIGFLN